MSSLPALHLCTSLGNTSQERGGDERGGGKHMQMMETCHRVPERDDALTRDDQSR